LKFITDDATPGLALKLALSLLRGERQESAGAARYHEGSLADRRP
jgi:hypothetical protein